MKISNMVPDGLKEHLEGEERVQELRRCYAQIKGTKSYIEIFGDMAGKARDEIERDISATYHSLAKKIHPDLFNNDPDACSMAGEILRLLNAYRTDAEKDLLSGNEYSFRSGEFEYTIFGSPVGGDFCSVYFGERSGNPGSDSICMKIANNIDNNSLVANEAYVLGKIKHKSIPEILDSFMLSGRKRANVLRRIDNGLDIHDIRELYTDGLPQEHAVWVMDRLLSVLGYLHSNNVIHGSIEPSNILITPANHNSFLLDYVFAISDANAANARYSGVNDYSAPEVGSGSAVHPASDMYSLGRTMVYMMGGDDAGMPDTVDDRIQEFLSGFLDEDPESRKDDAWKEYHNLSALRKEIFGAPHQFLHLDHRKKI